VGRDYVSVQYDTSIRPITSYPDKLAQRLCELHLIPSGAKLLEVGAGRPDVLNSNDKDYRCLAVIFHQLARKHVKRTKFLLT
jgi:hypothetical protein